MRATTRTGRATRNRVGRPKKEPTIATTAYLSEQKRAWIEEHGGATKAINDLIDNAIKVDNNCHCDNKCHQQSDNICQ